jgi:hypothetical protein
VENVALRVTVTQSEKKCGSKTVDDAMNYIS